MAKDHIALRIDIPLMIAERAVEALQPHDIRYLMELSKEEFELWCTREFGFQLGHRYRTEGIG